MDVAECGYKGGFALAMAGDEASHSEILVLKNCERSFTNLGIVNLNRPASKQMQWLRVSKAGNLQIHFDHGKNNSYIRQMAKIGKTIVNIRKPLPEKKWYNYS